MRSIPALVVVLVVAGLTVSAAAGTGDRVSQQGRFKIAWTHSSGPAWGTNGDIFVMNSDGSEQRNLSRHPAHDSEPAWSPVGGRIAFLSRRDGKQEIYVVNADGSGLQDLTRSPEHEFAPAWSPDGRKIAFTRSRDWYKRADVGLYVMNADGSGQRRLTYTKGRGDGNPVWSTDGRAAWSPDGREIAFTTKRDGNWELFVINADGTGQRNLTHNRANDYFRTWLPGGRIAFSSDRDGGNEFYVMNADGSGQRNLSHGWPSTYGGPWVAWSPSGERVAYVFGATRPGAKSSLYVMNTDGSGRQKLVDGVQYDAPPSWSTDGHRIAFERHLGGWERGSREIFTVNADGSGLQRLTRRPGQDDYPVWSPPQTR